MSRILVIFIIFWGVLYSSLGATHTDMREVYRFGTRLRELGSFLEGKTFSDKMTSIQEEYIHAYKPWVFNNYNRYSKESVQNEYYQLLHTLNENNIHDIYSDLTLEVNKAFWNEFFNDHDNLIHIFKLSNYPGRLLHHGDKLEDYAMKSLYDVEGDIHLQALKKDGHDLEHILTYAQDLDEDKKEFIKESLRRLCHAASSWLTVYKRTEGGGDEYDDDIPAKPEDCSDKVNYAFEKKSVWDFYFRLKRSFVQYSHNRVFYRRMYKNRHVSSRIEEDVFILTIRVEKSGSEGLDALIRDSLFEVYQLENFKLEVIQTPKGSGGIKVRLGNRGVSYANTSINTFVLDDQQLKAKSIKKIKRLVAHEVGHLLGFSDCYHEYYDVNKKEFNYITIDGSDFMCNVTGSFLPHHVSKLKYWYRSR